MKTKAMTMVAVLTFLLAAGTAIAQAPGSHIVADIPFDFMVNNSPMRAGQYTIERSGNSSWGTLLLRSSDDQKVKFILANQIESAKGADMTKLVFRHYGEQYFLGEIWVEGATTGRQLPVSRKEVSLAKKGTRVELAEVRALTR